MKYNIGEWVEVKCIMKVTEAKEDYFKKGDIAYILNVPGEMAWGGFNESYLNKIPQPEDK